MDPKLQQILMKSKAVMQASDIKSGAVSSRGETQTRRTPPTYNGLDGTQLLESVPEGATPQLPTYNTTRSASENITESSISNSNLPPDIKRLMMEQPIPSASPSHTFNLEDLPPELLKNAPQQTPQRPIHESMVGQPTGITENQVLQLIETVIDKKFNNELLRAHNKKVVEETVKKTLRLIKEGRIKL